MSPFSWDDLLESVEPARTPTRDDVVRVPTYDKSCSVPGGDFRQLMSAPALDEEGEYEGSARFEVADIQYAHIATSIRTDGRHRKPYFTTGFYHAPLFDIDIPHRAEQAQVPRFGPTDPEALNEWVLTFDVTAADGLDIRESQFRWNEDSLYFGEEYDRALRIAQRLISDLDLGSLSGRIKQGVALLEWRIYGDRFVLSPTSTPGHSHLYIDARLPEVTYMRLMVALARIGLLEPGFVRAACFRGHSAGRLPWVKKGSLVLSSEFKPEPTEPVTLTELEDWIDAGKTNLDPARPLGVDW